MYVTWLRMCVLVRMLLGVDRRSRCPICSSFVFLLVGMVVWRGRGMRGFACCVFVFSVVYTGIHTHIYVYMNII